MNKSKTCNEHVFRVVVGMIVSGLLLIGKAVVKNPFEYVTKWELGSENASSVSLL